MRLLNKIYFLFFLGAVAFSLTANAGEDIEVWTEHNGNTDSNATLFENILNASGSLGVIQSYSWEQISGPDTIEIINPNSSIASFSSSAGYGEEDKIFTFKLTVESLSAEDEDTIEITVKPEQNSPPEVSFEGLDNEEDSSINCGGSTDGSEDGFECILLFLNDYINEVTDPEDDAIISYNWYDEDNNVLSEQAFSVTFTSSEPHFLVYRAVDSYGDYEDAVITIYSSVQNTYPIVSILENVYYVDEYNDTNSNGEWDEGDEPAYIQIEASISDSEHLITDLEINWSVSCSGQNCNEYESFIDSNGDGEYNEGENFTDCGLDGVCSNDVECLLPDINGTEQNGEWDQATFLEFSEDEDINYSTGVASAMFYPPEVRYNSDNVQFTVTVTVRDPFQQNDNTISPSIASTGIIISNVNRPLSIESYDFEDAVEDEEFTIGLDNFEICDTDNTLDEISIILLNGNDYEITNQSQNKIIPTTESDENVDISVALLFSDGEEENNTVNYSAVINVIPINDIPEIIGIAPNLDFYEDTPFLLTTDNLLINDPDDDLWDLIIHENQSSSYLLEGNTITPYENYFGNLSIPIEVNDGESESEIYNLNISLIPVNDPPVAIWENDNISSFSLFIDEDFEDYTLFDFNDIFSDVDNEDLLFNYPLDQGFELFDIELDNSGNLILYSNFNINSSVNEQGLLEYENFEISVQDDQLASSNIYDFEITVLPKNDSPILYAGSEYVSMSVIGGENSSIIIDLTTDESSNGDESSAYVFDIENDLWFFEITDCPDNGSLLIGEPFEDFGLDGCNDEYEDGEGGCLENPNFGLDGCDDEYEDGEGGCLDDLNPLYLSSDPNEDNVDYNSDNYDPFSNPSGKELNCKWDEGENFEDENFSQNWDRFETYFVYQPNPGFRCVDQVKLKVIDNGFDYVESDGVSTIQENPMESNEVIAEIYVDLCNFSPEINSYNQEDISAINLLEDETLNIDDIDLDFFDFSDQDGDNIISIHAIAWNDYGQDGIPDTGDDGENNNEWDNGEGWNDCGEDGLCPDSLDYPGPDTGEGDGQINEDLIDNLRYSVVSECSNLQYESQIECEYNEEFWNTTVVFQENYNGSLSVAIQANDGQSAYNLSNPYIVDFYIQGVNDPPLISDAYILSVNNDTINYIYEDNTNIEFKIDMEDIDSSEDLNDSPFNLDNLIWEFNSENEHIYASEHSPNIFFIDSLRQDWNGEEIVNLEVCDEASRYCNDYNFIIKVLPVNDLPYNFSANYSILEGSITDSTIYEDNLGLSDGENKIIEYAISFEDVDCDSSLNNFHFAFNEESVTPDPFDPAIFIPDNLIWNTGYEGINIESFELLDFIEIDNNCNQELRYYKQIQFNTIRENWNGFDSISMYISSIESENSLDTTYLSVQVLPLNDSPQPFEIDAELYNYAMDETTFYTPCEFDDSPDCTELIHGYPFSSEDNFFRLHNVLDGNGEVLIEESVNYTNFDVGKILFKWDRTTDIDLDPSLNEYYTPNMYYRVELVEAGEYLDLNDNEQYDDGEPCDDINQNNICDSPSDYNFVIAEISDSLFNQDNICSEILGDNPLCSNDDFAFMNSPEYSWTVVDLTQPFFKYKDGFFDNPDTTSGEAGFYTSVDSTEGEYAYSYIDYLGTTEYKWKVTAYNRWWDDYEDDYENNENEIISESDEMRFFVDLERPSSDFSIIQNPLFGELYELYMITNEEVFISESSLFINNTPYNVLPFESSDNESGYSMFFYYSGEFGLDSPGTYNFELYTLDLLKNAGIADYSISYVYAAPGNFITMSSPSELMNLVIPEYSLIDPAGIIITENNLEINDFDKISISKEININSPNMNLQSPIKLRFLNDHSRDFDYRNIRIGSKNIHGNWDIISSEVSLDFIQADIFNEGSFALFYIEDIQGQIPQDFELIGCYPNPFNPNINIDFSIPYRTMVSVDVYDIKGNKIKTLVSQNLDAGFISLNWNGINDSGTFISSGVYLIKINAGDQQITQKITMLK